MDREAWSIAVQALHCPARREAGQRSCGGTGQGLQGRTAQLLLRRGHPRTLPFPPLLGEVASDVARLIGVCAGLG
jgi:hypothetical protein